MKFRDEYWFLSNMYPAPITLTRKGVRYTFNSVEAAFQACKCPDRMAEFQTLDGFQAKKLGGQVQLRPNWEDVKVPLMKTIVGMKFKQHPELAQALLNTNGIELVEDNTWGDTYWGRCNGVGQNHLGKILMETRAQLQNEQQAQTKPEPAKTKKPIQVLYDFDDIYNLPQGPNEILCITTNGVIKKDGSAVMGKGIALTADERFGISADLGRLLKEYKNHVFDMGMRTDSKTGRQVHIVTFPTKHHWKDDSDINLVKQSIQELVELCDRKGYTKCYTTAPGCALGHLDWETQVKPLMDAAMDDRFIVADWGLQNKYNRQHGIITDRTRLRPGEVPMRSTPNKTASQPAQAPSQEANTGKTLCFTGHRPKDMVPTPDRYTARPYQKFSKDLVLYLDEMYNAGYRNFISGGAQGFDQLAFWAVNRLKELHPDVKNIAYLPFKGQERNWPDNGGVFGPANYRKMLQLADEIVWTSEMQGIPVDLERNVNIAKALDMRNHAMVDDADLVIALYKDPKGVDMSMTHGSGTNNCMRYAMETGVPVYQIVCQNDSTGAIAPPPGINVMTPNVPRAPKKTPMWLQAKHAPPVQSEPVRPTQSSRNIQDIDAATMELTGQDDDPASQRIDIDY